MEEQPRASGLGEWLKEWCQREHLSLRQAGAKVGVSHSTIQGIINGGTASTATLRKLAHSVGGDGHRQQALEDKLLILAGHRTERVDGERSEPMARLLDRLSGLSEPKLKIMSSFADFLATLEEK